MNKLAKLAREVAWNMRELPDILKQFNLSPEEYARIVEIPFYKKALETLTIEWESAGSTEDRIKLQALMGTEDALPLVIARIQNPDETLNSAIEGIKMLTSIAGVNKEKAGGNAAEKFVININLGEDHKLTFEKDITPKGPAGAIPADVEGQGSPPPLRAIAIGKDEQVSIQQFATGANVKTEV